MISIRTLALFAVTTATLAVGGFIHGQRTGRWEDAETFAEIQDHLNQVAVACEVCGPWVCENVKTVINPIIRDEGTPNTWLRYVNKLNGQAVTVYLTCGRPGPMVIKHLPTECYPGAGFELTKAVSRYITPPLDGGKSAEFYLGTFAKTKDAMPLFLRNYWSWSGNGDWLTPERPRWTFAKYQRLYKLYVVRHMESEREPLEGSPAHDFIREFLPPLNKVLFPASVAPSKVTP